MATSLLVNCSFTSRYYFRMHSVNDNLVDCLLTNLRWELFFGRLLKLNLSADFPSRTSSNINRSVYRYRFVYC